MWLIVHIDDFFLFFLVVGVEMFRAVVTTTLTNFSIQGLSIITSSIVARMLGPEGRGELAVAMLWPSVVAGIALLGLDVVIARRSANAINDERQLYFTSLFFALLFGIFGSLVLLFLLPFLLPDDKQYLVFISNALLFFIPASLLNALLFSVELGKGRIFNYNASRLLFYVVYLILIICLWYLFEPETMLVAVCFVVAANVAAISTFFFLFFRAGRSISKSIAKISLVREALPFGLLSSVSSLSVHAPILLLAFLVDEEVIGLFVIAFMSASLHQSFAGSVGKIVFSSIARDSKAMIKTSLPSQLRELMIIYAGLTILMFVSLPYLVTFVFGAGFTPAGTAAAYMVPATAILAINLVLEDALKGIGSAKPAITGRIMGNIALVAAVWYWVPNYGLHGMVMAVFVRAISEFIVTLAFAAYLYNISWIKFFAFTRDDIVRLASRVGKFFN